MTKEEFLLDLIAYYGEDPEARRNFGPVSRLCKYSPIISTSEGCAIGRHLIGTLEEKKRWDIRGGYLSVLICINDNMLPDIRPEWMKGMNPDFLHCCQDLHDDIENWSYKGGLSSEGVKNVNSIIARYSLKLPLYEPTD